MLCLPAQLLFIHVLQALPMGLPFTQHFGPPFGQNNNPNLGPGIGVDFGPHFSLPTGPQVSPPFGLIHNLHFGHMFGNPTNPDFGVNLGPQFGPPFENIFHQTFNKDSVPRGVPFHESHPDPFKPQLPFNQVPPWLKFKFPLSDQQNLPNVPLGPSIGQHNELMNHGPFDHFHVLNTQNGVWKDISGEKLETRKNGTFKHLAHYDPRLPGSEKGIWKTIGKEGVSTARHEHQRAVSPRRQFKVFDVNRAHSPIDEQRSFSSGFVKKQPDGFAVKRNRFNNNGAIINEPLSLNPWAVPINTRDRPAFNVNGRKGFLKKRTSRPRKRITKKEPQQWDEYEIIHLGPYDDFDSVLNEHISRDGHKGGNIRHLHRKRQPVFSQKI